MRSGLFFRQRPNLRLIGNSQSRSRSFPLTITGQGQAGSPDFFKKAPLLSMLATIIGTVLSPRQSVPDKVVGSMHPDWRIAWHLHSIQPAGLRGGARCGRDGHDYHIKAS